MFVEVLIFAVVLVQLLILINLRHLNHKGAHIMASIDDLKAASAEETAELAVVAQALTDESARVDAALAALPPSDDPAVIAVTADLQAHTANLKTIAEALAKVAPAAAPTT